MAPQLGYAGVLTRQRKRPSTRQHERRNLRVRGLKARDRRTRNSLYFSIRALVIANSLRTRFGSVMCAHVRAGLGHAVGDQVCGGLRAARSICQRRRLGLDGQGFSTGWTYAPAVTPVSNITTGSGTRFDPYVITTVIDLGSIGVRLTQSFRYTRAAIHIFTRAGGSRIAASARTRR